MNTSPCRMLGILEDVCQIHGLFTLVLYHHPHLWSIKEPGIQTHIRWLFHDISLPSSWSASFLNKVIFFASTPRLWDSLACCVASRASLDSATKCLPQESGQVDHPGTQAGSTVASSGTWSPSADWKLGECRCGSQPAGMAWWSRSISALWPGHRGACQLTHSLLQRAELHSSACTWGREDRFCQTASVLYHEPHSILA